MANRCDYFMTIHCTEEQGRAIAGAIRAVSEEIEQYYYAPIICHLDRLGGGGYNFEAGDWVGLNEYPVYADGALSWPGCSKWSPPVRLADYLTQEYGVTVDIRGETENEVHEEWHITPDDPAPLLPRQKYLYDLRYPFREWLYRDGVPVSPDVARDDGERARLQAAQDAALREFDPDDLLTALPDVADECLQGETLDEIVVAARYYARDTRDEPEFDYAWDASNEGITREEWLARWCEYREERRSERAGRPDVEFLLLGRHGEDLVAIRQEDNSQCLHLEKTRPLWILWGHPPFVRDTEWVPRPWGRVRREWSDAGFCAAAQPVHLGSGVRSRIEEVSHGEEDQGSINDLKGVSEESLLGSPTSDTVAHVVPMVPWELRDLETCGPTDRVREHEASDSSKKPPGRAAGDVLDQAIEDTLRRIRELVDAPEDDSRQECSTPLIGHDLAFEGNKDIGAGRDRPIEKPAP